MIERVYTCLGDSNILCLTRAEAAEIFSFLQAVVRRTDHPAPDVEIPVGHKGFWICLGNQRAANLKRALDDALTHIAAADMAEVAHG